VENSRRKLKKGDIIALNGGLGSGKTTFVQGMLDSFGIKKFAKKREFRHRERIRLKKTGSFLIWTFIG